MIFIRGPERERGLEAETESGQRKGGGGIKTEPC